MKTDFCKKKVGQSVFEYFTDTGMLAMLEAADYKPADFASSFFGQILAVCCRNTRIASVPKVFKLYADLVNKVFWKKGVRG